MIDAIKEFLGKFADKNGEQTDEIVEDLGPPASLLVPMENIDFALPPGVRNQFSTEFVFTNSKNEHCYAVYDRETLVQLRTLHLSGGKTVILAINPDAPTVMQ